MATLSEMRDRVLDGTKRVGFTDATEVDRLINQTYRELIARTRTLQTSATVSLTSGQKTYTSADFALGDVFTTIRSITLTDSNGASGRLLMRVGMQEILDRSQVDPTNAIVSSYAYDGIDNITFYGTPQATTSTITVIYTVRPSEMVVDADVPNGIPLEFHDTIILGAMAKAVRIWNPQYGRLYHQAWMQSLDEYRRWLNRSGSVWMSKAIVRGSRDRLRGLDNDVYYSGMG